MGLLDRARAAHPERQWDEPFPRLFSQGVITSFSYQTGAGRYVPYGMVDFTPDPVHRETREPLIEKNEKMSKSRLNVVAPDDYVQKYGADVVRLFLMFIGPWEEGGAWNPRGIEGVQRFLNRAWTLATEPCADGREPDAGRTRELQRAVHQTLRKVTGDFERFSYNTAVAALMELGNALQRGSAAGGVPAAEWNRAITLMVLMLAPLAPHIAEELWERLGNAYSVHEQPWPAWDETLAAESTVEVAVQVNGKLRDRLVVAADASEAAVRDAALASEKVRAAIGGKPLRKCIYVPGRLVNLVVG